MKKALFAVALLAANLNAAIGSQVAYADKDKAGAGSAQKPAPPRGNTGQDRRAPPPTAPSDKKQKRQSDDVKMPDPPKKERSCPRGAACE